LKRSLGSMLQQCNFRKKRDRFGTDFEAQKGSPERSKMEPQTRQHRMQKPTLKKKALKTLLDPSWANLRSFSGRSWGQHLSNLCSCSTVSLKSSVFEQYKVGNCMLTDLGSILALKRVQDGSQIGSKTVSKRY
jgi:hypothetical protein